MSHLTHVLHSKSLGIFLGFEPLEARAYWSKMGTPKDNMRAPVYDVMPTNDAFVSASRSKLPLDAELVPVESANGLFASMKECVNAGLDAWGESMEDIIAERDRLLRSNIELTTALEHMVQQSVKQPDGGTKEVRVAPSWTAIVEAQDTLERSKKLIGKMTTSLDFGDSLPIERDRIKQMNTDLLHVLCKTLTALESADLKQIPGLVDAVPWAEIDAVLATKVHPSDEVRSGTGTALNDFQRTIADHYENGKFSNIETIEDAQEIGQSGDSLFAFLIKEAGDNLQEVELSDVVDRFEEVGHQVNQAINDLQDAHGTSPSNRA